MRRSRPTPLSGMATGAFGLLLLALGLSKLVELVGAGVVLLGDLIR